MLPRLSASFADGSGAIIGPASVGALGAEPILDVPQELPMFLRNQLSRTEVARLRHSTVGVLREKPSPPGLFDGKGYGSSLQEGPCQVVERPRAREIG